jgi:hypothetical protein
MSQHRSFNMFFLNSVSVRNRIKMFLWSYDKISLDNKTGKVLTT